jgi:predicted RNase H-like HicB family nuclease
MSEANDGYTVLVHDEGSGERMWAEVAELPGCFASGRDTGELGEALAEAISLYLEP